MGKLPAFQFYPADWRKDPGVQSLSFHDRGVWFEILCLMHESDQRGKLLLNGKPVPDEALARLLGLDKQIATKTITTLIEYGVASYDQETGALLCRRMVRDEKLRQVRQAAGKMGGNPALVKQNPKQSPTTQDKQNSTPSSSSSSSTTSNPPSEDRSRSRSQSSRSSRSQTCDDDWLKETQAKPAYQALNVALCYSKMVAWCEVKGKQPTRSRLLNWLNREEVPMKAAVIRPGLGLNKSKQVYEHNMALVEQMARERAAKGNYIDVEVINA